MIGKVAIFGDSWGYGPCRPILVDDIKIEEPGTIKFEELFAKQQISVDNYCFGGASNLQTLKKINDTVDKLDQVDRIIVFQTDPLRDVLQKPSLIDQFPCNNFEQFTDSLLSNFYNELNNFEQLRSKFLLVGGLGCLYTNSIPKGIDYLPRSVTQYLLPDFADETCYEYHGRVYEVGEMVRRARGWSVEFTAQELFEIEKKVLNKNHAWQTSDLFSWCHMSDQGIVVMAEILLKHLGETK